MSRSEAKVRRYPNLFLVGAPKCGTTSLAYYLGQHPEVFVPLIKEPLYFGSDLNIRKRHDGNSYLNLFRKWSVEKFALDATTAYFYSRSAASEIFAHQPDAKILIIVRNPIDAVHSMFYQNIFNGIEYITTFEAALSAEISRLDNVFTPQYGAFERLLYYSIYKYSVNISRFISVFGESNVHIIVLDDLRDNPVNEFINLCQCIGLNTSYIDDVNFIPRNTAKRARWKPIGQFATYPPSWLGYMTKPLLPQSVRLKIRNMIVEMNTLPASNPPMNPDTRRMLAEKFAPEVEWLSTLLDRDLSHWLHVDE